MTRTGIVVLNWNGTDDTIQCILSLGAQTNTAFDIIVVDNGSSPDQLIKLESFINGQNEPSLYLLKNSSNLGFAGGVNAGIRYCLESNYDYIVLLNNDAIPEKNWLPQLIKAADAHPDVSIVTSLILHQDGKTIDSTGDYYSIWGMSSARLRDKPSSKAPASGYVFGASGGASLYRSTLFRDIGIFDDKFFVYYEDVDISFRAQLHGHKVYYEKNAIVYHKRGASSAKIPGLATYHTFKNIPLLYVKNVPVQLLFTIGCRLFILYHLMILNAIRRGSGQYAVRGWLSSIVLFWSHGLRERRNIQGGKKVSANYMKGLMDHSLPPQSSLRGVIRIFSK